MIAQIGRILLVFVDVAFNILGLALVLRVLLPFFRMRSDHWLMRGIFVVTEPLLKVVRRHVHRPLGWMTSRAYVDFTPLMAFFFLWLVRSVLAFVLRLMIIPPLWLFTPTADLGLWLAHLLGWVFDLYFYAIFLRVLLDLIGMPLSHPLMRFVYKLTEPLMAPIRRRIPPFGIFDFTPFFAILVVVVVQTLLLTIVQLIF